MNLSLTGESITDAAVTESSTSINRIINISSQPYTKSYRIFGQLIQFKGQFSDQINHDKNYPNISLID